MIRAILACVALLTGALVNAEEHISRYDIEVDVSRDGSLLVTEHIQVRAEGNRIRRGIYRDFPTRYRDRYGNRVVVGFEVLGVERNGAPEPWFTENVSNGVRINTGNDDYLAVPADYTFTIRYRTTRQIGFFKEHDELYWNAIGGGWVFPIATASVIVRLPELVPAEQLKAEAYTGVQGAKGTDYVAEIVRHGEAHWRASRSLQPGENFTIVLSFPKGLIEAPSSTQRAAWFLKDNRGVLVALATLAALLIYCVREWQRVGRDPSKGVIIARYTPPAGHSPASVRYVSKMKYDTRCFSADILALAVAGFIRIAREDKLLRKDLWTLERTRKASTNELHRSESALLASIFKNKSSIELKNSNAIHLMSAKVAHRDLLDKASHPHYFKRNGSSTAKAAFIGLIGGALALWLAGGFGVPVIIAIGVLMVITVIVFATLVQAPTEEGRKLMDEIEGFKLYLSVAERDELARMKGPDGPPQLDAERYEKLLPFAVALEVEEAWTEKFTQAVGAAAAAQATNNIAWYRGGAISNLGNFSKTLGSSLTSQIASASTPPGSSSGSGGGGSAGGGGGGGGGGGR
jgi:uncharacterized membrane protein YgcG